MAQAQHEGKTDAYRDQIGSIKVSFCIVEEVLQISAKDKESFRAFESSFTLDQLKECGFPHKLTLQECAEVLSSAMGSTRVQYSRKPVAVNSIEGTLAPDTKPMAEDHDVLIDDYIDGASLLLLVSQEFGPIKMVYRLKLAEIAQNPTDQILAKMQRMQSQIESQQRELDALKADEKKSDIEIGVWASNTHSEVKGSNGHKNSFWNWNKVIIAPPNGLYEVIDYGKQIKFFKRGIYHIHGFGTANANTDEKEAYRQLFVIINGISVIAVIANTNNVKQCFATMNFSCVHKCNANDVMQIKQNQNRIFDNAQYSRLVIQRLAET